MSTEGVGAAMDAAAAHSDCATVTATSRARTGYQAAGPVSGWLAPGHRVGFDGQRLQYELSQLVPLGAMILLGLIFYGLERRTGTSRHSAVPAPGAVIEGLGAGE